MSRVLFYTGGFTHTMYRELFACSPEGFRMVPSSPDLTATDMKEDIRNSARRSFRWAAEAKRRLLDLGGRARLPLIKRRQVDADGIDLIHSAQYLLRGDTPWVVDFEDATTFAWYRAGFLRTRTGRDRLRRALEAPACRGLLPWTEAALQSLRSTIGPGDWEARTRVLLPSIRPVPERPGPDVEELNFLFVGTKFYEKGGLETLLAFDRLRCDRPVRLTIVSNTPRRVLDRWGGRSDIRFCSRLSPREMEETFRAADVFVLPVHTDTLGFVFLEAFARGIPCVSTRHYAIPELIDHGRTGLLVDGHASYFGDDRLPRFPLPALSPRHPLMRELLSPPERYVEDLADALQTLAGDAGLRAALGAAAREEVLNGRFSCGRRRREAGEAYRAALEVGSVAGRLAS